MPQGDYSVTTFTMNRIRFSQLLACTVHQEWLEEKNIAAGRIRFSPLLACDSK